MKLVAGCLIAVVFSIAYNSVWAQSASASIHGKIQAENAAPADAATVVLLSSQDSSVIKSTISSKEGIFDFSDIQTGTYLLFVTKLNYTKSYSGPYKVGEGKNLDAGVISLHQGAIQLSGVIITGKKDFVEVRPDRTVLNVDQNVMAAGNSLYDVLTTSPGVKVTNDEILYRGGQKAMIAIDGKPVLLSGDELVSFLKNYQSSSISQIELIDNPGGKYEASAAGGMINIILKKNKSEGSYFSFTGSGSAGQKYKSNVGINYSLRTEKLNLYASYGFQDNKVIHTISNDRLISSAGQLYDFNLDYDADIKSVNNNFSIGADYKISKMQSIGFLVNGFDNNITINKTNNTIVLTNGQRDSSINTLSNINRDINNISYNLNYNADLDRNGNSVLTVNADYLNYHRSSAELLQNDLFNAAGQKDSTLFFQDNSPSHITVKSAALDFSQKLSKTTHLGIGLKSSGVNSDNQIDFEQQINGKYTRDPDLTDHFLYKERIDAAYLQFDTKFNKTSISLGLRGENTSNSAYSMKPNQEVDSSYFDLFPNVSISQDLSRDNKLTLNYFRNINRPNYQDLNPFVGYVDQFYKSMGNPFLKPDYISTYEVSDLAMNKYRTTLSMVITDNYFNTIFEQDDVTKGYTSTKANLGTRYRYQLQFTAPVDLTPWWNVNADVQLFHEKYSYSNDTIASKQTNGAVLSLTQTFKLTSKLSLQWFNYYESPTYYVISNYQSLYFMDAGLTYSILQNKGSIKLAATDIFNSWSNRYHTNYANLDITAKDKLGSRFITATFTYRFGTSSSRRHSNTNEEQRRLGGSSNEN